METMEIGQQVDNNKKVLDLLKSLFLGKIDDEIIESVAYESGYEVEVATNNLIDIAGGGCNNAECITTKPKPKQKKDSFADIYDRIVRDARRGIKIMILLRGLPGSGKSYLAKKIVQESIGNCNTRDYILSADDYFYRNGVYCYEPRAISAAHEWNQSRAYQLLSTGVSPIIIDNTHTEVWELKPYSIWAVQHSYIIEILEPNNPWSFNDKELAKRNSHNVPRDKIRYMMDKYEKNVSVEKLFNVFHLCYKSDRLPPQPRKYPPIVIPPANLPKTNIEEPKQLIEKPKPKVEEPKPKVEQPIPEAEQPKPKIAERKSLLIYPDLNAWGINENSLNSWDIVEPIKENAMQAHKMQGIFSNAEIAPQVSPTVQDAATFMSKDIRKDLSNPFVKVITPGVFNSVAILTPSYPKSGMLDKGTMTEEIQEIPKGAVEMLSNLFTDIPSEYLEHLLDTCNGDVSWAINILLDDNNKLVEGYTPPPPPPTKMEIIEIVEEPQVIEIDEETKRAIKEDGEQIKQHLKNNIVINKEHYSEHMLKVKNPYYNAEPSTSTSTKVETTATPAGDVIGVDSDMDFEEVIEINSDNEDMVELNLGDAFVSQLEEHFGDPKVKYPQGFQPVIEVPKSLAKQLHALYLESIFKQMDTQNQIIANMIKEDEEFARKLQAEEEENTVQATPDLRNIMVEQRELTRQDSLNEEWRNQTPDNIAYKLTIKKLIAEFPNVAMDILTEIYHAHDYCYNKTVEVLIESGQKRVEEPKGSTKDATISVEILQDMKREYLNRNQPNTETNSADELREEASFSYRKRKDLLLKAQQYHRMGMNEVALYYSNLAAEQTQIYERLNNEAAEQILADHAKRNNFDTLDLHYLRVTEAVNALDIFIDRNIMLLQGNNRNKSNEVFILTGRGKNSARGIPKIRPAIIDRLKSRKIRFKFENPGLLKAKILQNSAMTSSLMN